MNDVRRTDGPPRSRRVTESAARVPLLGLIVWGVVAPVAIVSLIVRAALRHRRRRGLS